MNKAIKAPLFILVGISFISILLSCETQVQEELGDDEIKALLSEVMADEKSIEEEGLRYFSELSSESNNIIQAQVLHDSLQRGEDYFVLDIRRETDFPNGHIQGAENIWWFDVGTKIDRLPKDRRIVVTCYTGQSAGQVVGVLRVMGYEAFSLAGGMNNGWLAAKLPVVQ